MATTIRPGVWPTMITPFTDDDRIDFDSVGRMVEWYIRQGCDGLFAVCQSSEMAYLSGAEKAELGRAVARAARGRIPVVASGHTAPDLKTQMADIEAMMRAGVEAYVLVSNALDPHNEGQSALMGSFEAIVKAFPGARFGLYECPQPYKRLLTLDELRELAQGGQLTFFKDTCCDCGILQERLKALRGTALSLYNANAASLYDSLLHGAAGYSGPLANYHPELYGYLVRHAGMEPEESLLELSRLLTVMAMITKRHYPLTAKHHMNRVGVPMSLHSRSIDAALFDANARMEVECLIDLARELRGKLGIPENIG